MQQEQTKYPLATLVLEADKRNIAQRARLLALAANIAKQRGIEL